jgi:hypothetical protein
LAAKPPYSIDRLARINSMNESREVLFAKEGTAAGGGANDAPNLLVVCHGLFLFQISKADDGAYWLFVDAPVVPARPGKKGKGGDPGHVYLANSRVSIDGALDLGDTAKAYRLTGPAPVPLSRMTPHFGRSSDKWHDDSNLVLPFKHQRSTKEAAYTIVMPLPEDYWGWRSISPMRSKNGSRLFSPYVAKADPVKGALPWSIFTTHVFRYSGASSLTLQRDGKQVWPAGSAPETVLHLFSQEGDVEAAVRLFKKGGGWDHLEYLNALVDPNPGLSMAPGSRLAAMEDPTIPWGLRREDLLWLGERGTAARHRGFRMVGGKLVGCSSGYSLPLCPFGPRRCPSRPFPR